MNEQAIPRAAHEAIELRPAKALAPYARNARTHTREQVSQVAESIRRFRWTNPILIDEQDGIVAGHARVLAAHEIYKRGETISTVGGSALPAGQVPVIVARGWSDAEKRAYVMADNQLAINAGWDKDILKLELGELRTMDFDLGLVGFSDVQIGNIFAGLELDDAGGGGKGEDDSASPSEATLLALVDVTIREPTHGVDRGDVWRVGPHTLICASLMREWAVWAPYLKDGAIFCPYPGPFVPFATTEEGETLILVQPDHYIAGHLIDRYAEAYGEDKVRRVKGVQ